MQSKSYLRLRSAGAQATLSAEILLLLILVVPVKGASQQEKPERPVIGLEIRQGDDSKAPLRLGGPRGMGMVPIQRRSLRINNPVAAGAFTLLQIQAEIEGDGMRVSVSLIYNELSDREWWQHKNEKIVGSYLIRSGDSIRTTELNEFGIEPFEIKGVDARPVLLKPGEGPQIKNSSALEVQKLERNFDFYRIWLKNISGKNIVSYQISTGNGHIDVGGGDYGRHGIALEAGATSRELDLHDTEIEVKGITVPLVVFDDGTFEGDAKLATNYLARAEGVKIQSPSVLRMIEQTLKVDDSDLRAAFQKLEADLWIIPEALYKAPAIEFLKVKFPDQDEKTVSALYEVFKGGLYDSRNIALQQLGDTGRFVKTLEERGEFASAVEIIKRTLERLKETFGKITNGKQ